MKSCPYCGAQYPDDLEVCPLDAQPLVGLAATRVADGASKIICPQCGAADDYTVTVQPHRAFSWGIFFLGGLLAVMFRNGGRRRRVRCNQCDARFSIRTPLSRISLVIFWLLVGPTIIYLALLLIAFITGLFRH
jgi:uncharacterized Zn-finger protein